MLREDTVGDIVHQHDSDRAFSIMSLDNGHWLALLVGILDTVLELLWWNSSVNKNEYPLLPCPPIVNSGLVKTSTASVATAAFHSDDDHGQYHWHQNVLKSVDSYPCDMDNGCNFGHKDTSLKMSKCSQSLPGCQAWQINNLGIYRKSEKFLINSNENIDSGKITYL